MAAKRLFKSLDPDATPPTGVKFWLKNKGEAEGELKAHKLMLGIAIHCTNLLQHFLIRRSKPIWTMLGKGAACTQTRLNKQANNRRTSIIYNITGLELNPGQDGA